MENKEITVLYGTVGKMPDLVKIDPEDISAIHKLIGGYFECITIDGDMIMLVDVAARIKSRPYACTIRALDAEIPIFGDWMIVRKKGQGFGSINSRMTKKFMCGILRNIMLENGATNGK